MPGETAPPRTAAATQQDVLSEPLSSRDAPARMAAGKTDHSGARSFPGRVDQVREARAFAAGFVTGSPLADDIVLCVSELSANAVLHSHSREYGGEFTVRIEVYAPDYTCIEVEDGGGPWQQQPDTALAGHGLDIVAKLASDWGIDGGPNGWIVWARMDWPLS